MTRDQLLERIVKGAEYIESIDPTHPKWEVAHKRYNDLCADLFGMDKPAWMELDVKARETAKIRAMLPPKKQSDRRRRA